MRPPTFARHPLPWGRKPHAQHLGAEIARADDLKEKPLAIDGRLVVLP